MLRTDRPAAAGIQEDREKAGSGKNAAEFPFAAVLTGLFFVLSILLICIKGEDSVVAIQDNLDLFQAQYRMLKNTGTFFTNGAAAPFLGGISRDVLPSGLQLTGLLYFFFPPFAAYFIQYFLKILIGMISMGLLVSEVLSLMGEKPGRKNVLLLCAFSYGAVCFFPAFSICFASIPLAVYLLIRLEKAKTAGEQALFLILLFLYPFLSYFSYHGFFLIAYFTLAAVVLSIRARKIRVRAFLAVFVLSAGFVFFEYRLFSQMLLTGEPTIRDTMKMTSLSFLDAFRFMAEGFSKGMLHAEAVQQYVVMPVCLAVFAVRLIRKDRCTEFQKKVNRLGGLILFIILFNSFIYGAYYLEWFRNLVELVLPPLKGFQFNRTVFFNPALWYFWFTLTLLSLKKEWPAVLAALAAAAVVLLSPTRYNDLYFTARSAAAQMLGRNQAALTYREFYSEDLFTMIKNDVGYHEGDFKGPKPYRSAGAQAGTPEILDGSGADWSVAFGFYPGVLEYNGIATLDGYLGFYSQAYKEKFREVIAPAFEENESGRAYFDDWGAQCYLYPAREETVIQSMRHYPAGSAETIKLPVDPGALRSLHCRYVFSRLQLENAEELGLSLRGVYGADSSCYVVYVYEFP